MSDQRKILHLGRFVFCVHRDGFWIRDGRGNGPGYVMLGPRHRPLHSERNDIGGKVIFRCRGWRIRRMKQLARAAGSDGLQIAPRQG